MTNTIAPTPAVEEVPLPAGLEPAASPAAETAPTPIVEATVATPTPLAIPQAVGVAPVIAEPTPVVDPVTAPRVGFAQKAKHKLAEARQTEVTVTITSPEGTNAVARKGLLAKVVRLWLALLVGAAITGAALWGTTAFFSAKTAELNGRIGGLRVELAQSAAALASTKAELAAAEAALKAEKAKPWWARLMIWW